MLSFFSIWRWIVSDIESQPKVLSSDDLQQIHEDYQAEYESSSPYFDWDSDDREVDNGPWFMDFDNELPEDYI